MPRGLDLVNKRHEEKNGMKKADDDGDDDGDGDGDGDGDNGVCTWPMEMDFLGSLASLISRALRLQRVVSILVASITGIDFVSVVSGHASSSLGGIL